jgi:hypothetical protein
MSYLMFASASGSPRKEYGPEAPLSPFNPGRPKCSVARYYVNWRIPTLHKPRNSSCATPVMAMFVVTVMAKAPKVIGIIKPEKMFVNYFQVRFFGVFT